MMRMLAWVNLLQTDGYVNRFLTFTHVLGQPRDWLGGSASTVILALVYGYIPFLILPLFASLDRIDRSHLEAARDLGASPWAPFRTVTLPLSKTGILGGAVLITLPMFGDYYTPNIVSGSPKTSMVGNQIDLYFHGEVPADDRRCPHDHPRRLPDAPHGLLHVEHPPGTAGGRGGGSGLTVVAERARARGSRAWARLRGWLRNPGATALPRRHHVGLRPLVDRAGAHRGAVLVQRDALPDGLGLLLDALVLGRPGGLGLERPDAPARPRPEPSSWRARTS